MLSSCHRCAAVSAHTGKRPVQSHFSACPPLPLRMLGSRQWCGAQSTQRGIALNDATCFLTGCKERPKKCVPAS